MNLKNMDKFEFNSVFGKLLLSYGIVVVIVTVTLGVVSYLFFASCYNREIEAVHQKVLEQVADTFRFQMMQPITQCFFSLSADYSDPTTNLLHFTKSTAGNHKKIYQTYEYLKQAVAVHSGMINAVHVYYKKQNLLISSTLGSSFLNQKGRHNDKNPYWIDRFNHNSQRSVWLEPQNAYFNPPQGGLGFPRTDVFTFIRTFPVITAGRNFQGLIAIDVSENTLSHLIQKTIPAQYQNTFIINNQGRIISHPQKRLLFQLMDQESYIRRIIASPLTYDSFIHKVGRRNSMVTFTSLPNTDWKIVNIIPIDRFYQSTRFIQLLLIVICLLAILIGLLLSFVFTRQIYNPLGVITEKVRKLAGPRVSAPKENEYGFINQVIDEIALKVQSLRENGPALQNNLIMELLYHRFASEPELAEKVKALDDTFSFPYYYVVLFQMDEAAIKDFTLEKSQMIKNYLNQEIQKIDDGQRKCLQVDLSDWQIGVIAGVKEADSAFVDGLIEKIIANSLTNYQLPITATVGTRVSSLLEIQQSFHEATLLQQYHYFFPQLPLISSEAFLKKEQSDETLPDSLFSDFANGLRRRDLRLIDQTLTRLITTLTAGNYSATYCQQVILEITHLFSMYLKEMRYTLSKNEQSGLRNLLLTTGDIHGFKNWICGFAERVFNWVAARTDNRNYQIIEKARQYLATHLEADLSLEAVAELVNLSPNYFCKVFKESTGAGFTAYLNDLRIEKAQELLLQTNLSIQEIGLKVGYNAPAYFIKQFKAKSGYTPYDYRRQFQSQKFLP